MYSVIQNGLTNVDPSAMLMVFGLQVVATDVHQHRSGDRLTDAASGRASTRTSRSSAMEIDVSKPSTLFAIAGFGMSILAVVSALLQLVQSRMMLPAADPANDDPNARIQRQMMLFLPLISVVYGGFLPAGLFIYWIVATIFSIVQQYLIVGWGSLFPIFGWTPAFAVDHTPRFPVSMPPPPEPSKRAAILADAEKKTTADKTIRRTRARTAGPTRETTLTMSAYKEFTGKTVEEALQGSARRVRCGAQRPRFRDPHPGQPWRPRHGRGAGAHRGRAALGARWRRAEA